MSEKGGRECTESLVGGGGGGHGKMPFVPSLLIWTSPFEVMLPTWGPCMLFAPGKSESQMHPVLADVDLAQCK